MNTHLSWRELARIFWFEAKVFGLTLAVQTGAGLIEIGSGLTRIITLGIYRPFWRDAYFYRVSTWMHRRIREAARITQEDSD